jgi:hypothetical protein
MEYNGGAAHQFALLHQQPCSFGGRTELFNQVAIGHHTRARPIPLHNLCTDEHGAWCKVRRQASCKPEAHEALWGEGTDQETSALERSPVPDTDLDGNMPACRRWGTVDRKRVCLQALVMTNEDKSGGDFTR